MPLKLSQTAIKLRSALQEVLYVVATVNPSVNDDRNDGYIIGSRWINTTTDEEFVCVDNTNTAAVWSSTTSGGGGGGSIVVTTTDPTVNDDSGDGYTIGTIWINTTTNTIFIATSVAATAAIWVNISGGGGNIVTTTTDPTVNDDIGDGYVIGTLWINTTTDDVFVATDVSAAAAVWVQLNSGGAAIDITATPSGGNAGTNVQAQLDNINAAIANMFFVGRLLTLFAVFTDVIPDYRLFTTEFFNVSIVPGFNTVAF